MTALKAETHKTPICWSIHPQTEPSHDSNRLPPADTERRALFTTSTCTHLHTHALLGLSSSSSSSHPRLPPLLLTPDPGPADVDRHSYSEPRWGVDECARESVRSRAAGLQAASEGGWQENRSGLKERSSTAEG